MKNQIEDNMGPGGELLSDRLLCADLFAGAGGFSKAALDCNMEIRVAIENNPHAAKTYKRNLIKGANCATSLYSEDITGLSPLSIAEQHFAEGERCDLLLGGPPCQGFSSHRINDAGVDDPRNSLIHTYFEFVKALKPRMFLMENVPGMLWPRHADYITEFYARGRGAGYEVFQPVVLDARDFGVPQRRKRVFILGVHGDVPRRGQLQWPPAPTHGNPSTLREGDGRKAWVSCVDESVFSPAPDADPNDRHMNHTDELISAFKETPANGGSRKDTSRKLKCHEDHDGHKDVYGRINSFEPAPTMTTACINPSKGRFVHPTDHHGITVRQAARIQTFPDNFVFEGGLIASGQQIGNAVPIRLGKALIQHLCQFLKTHQ